MSYPIPWSKRAFDVCVGLIMALSLLPVLSVLVICLLITEGPPVFYVSRRRVDMGPAKKVIKFRTMRRDADRIVNRDTVPVDGTRFLNLPIDSPLYTAVGRFAE